MNLAPDKQHSDVVDKVIPLMKQGATFSYAHGLNIVEVGARIREDITVIMVAPKCPGTEVREEYKRGFGVPTLIAVHGENDPNGDGLEIAKALCSAQGGDRAGVLESSFIAEVKSDLMGEQTILCGMLQAGSLLCFDKMVAGGVSAPWAAKLVQKGWETVTEALKHGGITNMLDRLSNPAKLKTYELAEELKVILRPLFEKHMDDILSGEFSRTMMEDWANDDVKLLTWREETGKSAFEQTEAVGDITEQEYFDKGILMVAMVKAGVELAFEVMVEGGHRAGIGLLRIPARNPVDRQHHRPEKTLRNEPRHFRHGRVRLLPVRPCLRSPAAGFHDVRRLRCHRQRPECQRRWCRQPDPGRNQRRNSRPSD